MVPGSWLVQPFMSGDKIRLGKSVNITYMAPASIQAAAPAVASLEADATIARSAGAMQTMIGEEPRLAAWQALRRN